mgnify:CR=1 FL=1
MENLTRINLMKKMDAFIASELNGSKRKLATISGVKYHVIVDFYRGKTDIFGFEDLMKINNILENKNQKTTAKSQNQEKQIASIPVYDIRASAGNGSVIHEENILYHTTFNLEFLKRVSSAQMEMLAVITVDGDSMQPTLSPEDTVLIDRSQITPKRDGIYVLRYDDSLLVKRLRYDPQRGIVTIISDNDLYPPLDITDLECLKIIGRVLWMGRRV